MIRDLFRILGPQNQGRYRGILVGAGMVGRMLGVGGA